MMTNTYKAAPGWENTYGEGVLELDLSPTDERDLISAGRLIQVARKYRCLADNYQLAAQGDEFEAAFPVEVEAALISGGTVERVDKEKPAEKTAAKKTAGKKQSDDD